MFGWLRGMLASGAVKRPAAAHAAYHLTWVTDSLAVGHAPMSVAECDSLHEQGIDAIMNLCAEYCDLHEIEAKQGFEVYYLPVPDEESPELEELERGLAWLDEAIYLGKKVLIHCRHGIGRTGTVLNAYLLRRGLGHRMAGQTLKNLRAKPASFDQWWAVRNYGKKSGRLTVREPSLEFKRAVDLSPFLGDYESLAALTEERLAANGANGADTPRCGRDHARCCSTPVMLTLVEAVFLTTRMNRDLTSEHRMALIDRAVGVARMERAATSELGDAEYCLSGVGASCPLSEEGRCILYASRPLQCRSYELPERVNAELWEDVLDGALAKLARDIYVALASSLPLGELPLFPLPDVVSGRYVQAFFHLMMRSENGG